MLKKTYITVATLLLTAGVAFAQCSWMYGNASSTHAALEAKQNINSNPDQQKQMANINPKIYREMMELRLSIMELQKEITELTQSKVQDKTKINAKIEELAKLQAKLMKKELEFAKDIPNPPMPLQPMTPWNNSHPPTPLQPMTPWNNSHGWMGPGRYGNWCWFDSPGSWSGYNNGYGWNWPNMRTGWGCW